MSIAHKLFKPIILLMLCLSMLSCDRLFDDRPKTMTIEYDEEVKLHDGEMIWVHITRHYVLAGGGAIGDPGAFERHYFPKEVEISWDTGFEGVGRKSLLFKEYVSYFDFKDNVYFIIGSRNKASNAQGKYGDSCGSTYGIMGFAIVYDDKNQCRKIQDWQDFPTDPVLNIGTFKATVPEDWDGKRLSWQFKTQNSNLFKNFNERIVQKPFD